MPAIAGSDPCVLRMREEQQGPYTYKLTVTVMCFLKIHSCAASSALADTSPLSSILNLPFTLQFTTHENDSVMQVASHANVFVMDLGGLFSSVPERIYQREVKKSIGEESSLTGSSERLPINRTKFHYHFFKEARMGRDSRRFLDSKRDLSIPSARRHRAYGRKQQSTAA